MKKFLSIVLTISMLFAFAACANNSGEDLSEYDFAKGQPVKAPDSSLSVIVNNIDIEYKYLEETTASEEPLKTGTYIAISGLKDKEVEASINAEIKAMFDEMWNETEMPPYMGSKIAARRIAEKNMSVEYSSIYMDVQYNSGNILSVAGSLSCSLYSDGYEDGFYWIDERTLNFDLKSGKQIALADVVCDSEKGLEFFNKKLKEAFAKSDVFDETSDNWYADDDSLTCIGEFKGLKPDQKYYINKYDNGVTLVFDYETPEIALSDYLPKYYYISLDGVGALDNRFKAEGLYVDETPVYNFKSTDYDEYKHQVQYLFSEDETYPRIMIDESYSWNDEMPEEMINHLKPGSVDKETYIEKARAKYDEIVAMGEYENVFGNLFINTGYDRVGNYTNLFNSAYIDISASSGDNYQSFSENCGDTVVYKDGVGVIELKDVFKEGTDIENCIRRGIYEYVLDYTGWEDEAYLEKLSEYAGAVYESMGGFELMSSALELMHTDTDKLIMEYFPEVYEPWEIGSRSRMIPYEYLGFENLSIFE